MSRAALAAARGQCFRQLQTRYRQVRQPGLLLWGADDRVSRARFGERLAHGPMIFALAVGLVALAGFAGDSAIAWLGVDVIRMYAPVKIGYTIRFAVTVQSS